MAARNGRRTRGTWQKGTDGDAAVGRGRGRGGGRGGGCGGGCDYPSVWRRRRRRGRACGPRRRGPRRRPGTPPPAAAAAPPAPATPAQTCRGEGGGGGGRAGVGGALGACRREPATAHTREPGAASKAPGPRPRWVGTGRPSRSSGRAFNRRAHPVPRPSLHAVPPLEAAGVAGAGRAWSMLTL